MTEKELQGLVIDAAKLTGWRVYHTHDSRRSEPGFPDLVMVKGHRLIFSELGKTTPAQDSWIEALAPNAEVYLWRPQHWEDGLITAILQGAKYTSRPKRPLTPNTGKKTL
jgi:hypothetical protein